MRSKLSLCLTTCLLAGCTVGPNYAGPPKIAGGEGASFVRADTSVTNFTPGVADWWTVLGDRTLDGLITRAIAANADLQAAEARLRQARAALGEQRANGAPNLNASAVYAHARIPGSSIGGSSSESGGSDGAGENGSAGGGDSSLNLFNLGFDASWEIDLFGGQRRALEAARAKAEGAEASLADVQVSISANVAQTYLSLRERQQRIALGEQAIGMQQDILGLTRQRYAAGTAAAADVAQAESQLATSRAQLAPLAADRDAYLNALAVLCGEQPGALDAQLAAPGDIPLPPASVPVGDPASLIAHRPDIRVAERQLAADTAAIGQVEAARFPRLSFLGLIGIGGTKLGDLSNLDDFVAIGAPRLSWSILDFGRNKAKLGQAEARRDEAEARYRSAVLTALRDAEDSLARFRERRVTVASLARVRDQAVLAARLAQDRYAAGTATRTVALSAQTDLNRAEQELLSARAALTADYVAINKALGLAWTGPA